MKRSEINAIIRDAEAFLNEYRFRLPPFAFWSLKEWSKMGPEAAEIVERGLGWDITDFGLGDYAKAGLFLFTIRNGRLEDLRRGIGKVYAEKIMIVGVGQETPYHFHWNKVEDIINRGGGKLVLELAQSSPDGARMLEEDVEVSLDGVRRTFRAKEQVVLAPGESITLVTGLYHRFYGAEGRVLVGEVSAVNDDNTDNRFFAPVGRFPAIVEDEEPYYLLAQDYPRFYRA
jgi:hypothetical protein